MKKLILIFFLLSWLFPHNHYSQNIPSKSIVPLENLVNYLKEDSKEKISDTSIKGLAEFFRKRFSERYFFDFRESDSRFKIYNQLYPKMEEQHENRALDHISKFADSTKWKLPFNYLNGEEVNAYALRHLARQHKMVDIAFYYRYNNKDEKYLNYFTNQLSSLNHALSIDAYETIDDGNGVYEAFRSGYRILNWLQIHNSFLGDPNYSDKEQLTTIATLLQHASDLYKENESFTPGNHQTRGLSALAMLSILFRDLKDADMWYNRSMTLLEEHLNKEINKDGFQFERTIHYHQSDIDNYFYVYQLAKISGMEVSPVWEDKLRSLFVTLSKVAYPDGSAPVLSDDTDTPWAEKNDISGTMTLGYLLFKDATMGYFSKGKVEPKYIWYLTDEQLDKINNIETETPSYKSLSFDSTGYFIMREGWNENDKMMIISAGLDPDKPDHQHGDMLGIQAMANGNVILPNYQVRYSLEDLELFKNSMVKNVALVDDELQGNEYTSNKGGSGFGKFKVLPKPTTIIWEMTKKNDLYIGSHDGFENIGVKYSRQLIYIKDDFWIVKDNFTSERAHTYKQIWQGHYTYENGSNLIRSTFENGSGLDIFQLNKIDTVSNSGQRGKGWSTLSKNNETNFSFITVLSPFSVYDQRIDENSPLPQLKEWRSNSSDLKFQPQEANILSKEGEYYAFGLKSIEIKNSEIVFKSVSDIYIDYYENEITVQSLDVLDIELEVNAKVRGNSNKRKFQLKPGESVSIQID